MTTIALLALIVLLAVLLLLACIKLDFTRDLLDVVKHDADLGREADEYCISCLRQLATDNDASARMFRDAARGWQRRALDAEKCLELVLNDRRGTVSVELTADTSEFERGMRRVGEALKGWGAGGRFH